MKFEFTKLKNGEEIEYSLVRGFYRILILILLLVVAWQGISYFTGHGTMFDEKNSSETNWLESFIDNRTIDDDEIGDVVVEDIQKEAAWQSGIPVEGR